VSTDRPLTPDEQEQLARYLAAQMSRDQQEAFEQRILDDPALAEAVYSQAALDPHLPVRGAAAPRVVRLPERRPQAWRWGFALPVAAAVIAALVLTLPGRIGRHAPADQMRGAEAVPRLREPAATVDHLPARFAWSAAAGAVTYRLQIVAVDSTLIYQATTADTAIEIPAGALPATLVSARWRVVPYDDAGLELPIPPYAEFRVVPR